MQGVWQWCPTCTSALAAAMCLCMLNMMGPAAVATAELLAGDWPGASRLSG